MSEPQQKLIPPRPQPPRVFPFGQVVFWGCLVLAAALALDHVLKLNGPNEPVETFVGLDHRWAVEEVAWRQFSEHWELSVLLRLVGSLSYDGAPVETLQALPTARAVCGAVLANLPRRHDPPIAREDVFRLNINFLEEEPIFPFPVPLNIENRACPQELPEARFPLNYAGDMAGWEFYGFSYTPDPIVSHWNVEATVYFFWRGPGLTFVSLSDLCTAAVFEAKHWSLDGRLADNAKIAIGHQLSRDRVIYHFAQVDGDGCRFPDPPEVEDV